MDAIGNQQRVERGFFRLGVFKSLHHWRIEIGDA